MNETELDRLLDAWEAPMPPASLRKKLRDRFPRAERRKIARPLRWGLVIAILTVALAGVAQTGSENWNIPLVRALTEWYTGFLQAMETRQAVAIRSRIRESNPLVYVDGQLAGPVEYGPAARMDVQVPGDGVYSVVTYSVVVDRGSQRVQAQKAGWIEAGRIHANVIEFQAGGRQVRIVCGHPIVDTDQPVFVRRLP